MNIRKKQLLAVAILGFFFVVLATQEAILTINSINGLAFGQNPVFSAKPSGSNLFSPKNNSSDTEEDGRVLAGLTGAQDVTAIWANNGEDKVTRDEHRATLGINVNNSVWDGSKVSVFGARNKVVAFNMVLEAGSGNAGNISVSFDKLTGPGGATIESVPATGNGVFDWSNRNIELFYVRYLPIKGLSAFGYGFYDERHIPQRFRLPWTGEGYSNTNNANGKWTDRPDHDKYYPDIAVPLELVPSFTIPSGQNQSVWVDIYIPKEAPAGEYSGTLLVKGANGTQSSVPVKLQVYSFTLPDEPSAKTMLFYSGTSIKRRYLGNNYYNQGSPEITKSNLIMDRHYQLAHRHRFSLIGDGEECPLSNYQPCPISIPRLNGSLFTAAKGYGGPGVGVGNDIYSIGTYGTWAWKNGTEQDMRTYTDAWATWFAQNSPSTEFFLYLIDEVNDFPLIEKWSKWILDNPGPGRAVKSLATIFLANAALYAPSLDIPTTSGWLNKPPLPWRSPGEFISQYSNDSRKRFYMYNGGRPAGSTVTEDDGVALRERAWSQFKMHINRWFFWETTYYYNGQGDATETSLFQNARTFGRSDSINPSIGEWGYLHTNGDGVLFYPGTDKVFPADSYNVEGPFASLRLKYWRRGLQDVDYLTMASAVNPAGVNSIVNQIIPKALWEYGAGDPLNDPTWVSTNISWSNNPDVWEAARLQLANMLGSVPGSTPPAPTPTPTPPTPTPTPPTPTPTPPTPTPTPPTPTPTPPTPTPTPPTPTPTPPPNTAPSASLGDFKISFIQAKSLTSDQPYIQFVTDNLTYGQVEYGETAGYGKVTTLTDKPLFTNYIYLPNLKPKTWYHYRVLSIDLAGRKAVSGDGTFYTGVLESISPSAPVTPPLPPAAVLPPLVSPPSASPPGNVSERPNLASGDLVNDKGTIYLIYGTTKIPFSTFKAFQGLGYKLKNVVNGDTAGIPRQEGYIIKSDSQAHPWGSWLIRGKAVYYFSPQGMIAISSMKIFTANGGTQKEILPMNKADLNELTANSNLPILEENDYRVIK